MLFERFASDPETSEGVQYILITLTFRLPILIKQLDDFQLYLEWKAE